MRLKYAAFFQGLKQSRITVLLTDSNPSSHGVGTTIDVKNYVISIKISVAISHYLFYLKVMDDWQAQSKSVGCIRHLPSLIHKLWKLYDELMTYDKVTNSEVDVQKLTYEKLMTHLG